MNSFLTADIFRGAYAYAPVENYMNLLQIYLR